MMLEAAMILFWVVKVLTTSNYKYLLQIPAFLSWNNAKTLIYIMKSTGLSFQLIADSEMKGVLSVSPQIKTMKTNIVTNAL